MSKQNLQCIGGVKEGQKNWWNRCIRQNECQFYNEWLKVDYLWLYFGMEIVDLEPRFAGHVEVFKLEKGLEYHVWA